MLRILALCCLLLALASLSGCGRTPDGRLCVTTTKCSDEPPMVGANVRVDNRLPGSTCRVFSDRYNGGGWFLRTGEYKIIEHSYLDSEFRSVRISGDCCLRSGEMRSFDLSVVPAYSRQVFLDQRSTYPKEGTDPALCRR